MKDYKRGAIALILISIVVLLIIIFGFYSYYQKAKVIPDTTSQLINPISLNELNNLTYSDNPDFNSWLKAYGHGPESLTLKDGFYQSTYAPCVGIHGTCGGPYVFAKMNRYAINNAGDKAVVLISAGYDESRVHFEKFVKSRLGEFDGLYLVTKDQSGKTSVGNSPFHLYRLDLVTVSNLSLSSDKIIMIAYVDQNDGHGNFTRINKTYNFKINDSGFTLEN